MNITQLQQFAKHLQQRIDTNPNDLDAIADLAVVLVQLGQTAPALALLLPAAQKYPEHSGLQHNLAELYRNTGETDKAEVLFNRLINQRPYFLPAYHSLLLILNSENSLKH